jgi:hypothetical protein
MTTIIRVRRGSHRRRGRDRDAQPDQRALPFAGQPDGGQHSQPAARVIHAYEVPPLDDRLPDPRLIYLQTMLGAVEMLHNGATAVHDDACCNPWPTRPAIVMNARCGPNFTRWVGNGR